MSRKNPSPEIVVFTVGDVAPGAQDYVRRQIEIFVRRLPEHWESATVKLTAYRKPTVAWPALVQANLVVDRTLIRAQLAATFFQEAGKLLRARLTDQLTRVTHPQVARPWPQPQRRHDRPALLPRPAGKREIVRRKRYPLATCAPDQAALLMDVRDYDFHLFIDADTGQDSIVYRAGPTGYRLARLAGMAPPSGAPVMPWAINVHPVPRLEAKEAVARLDATDLPFLFFQDKETGRGTVLYLRYDGHYGIVTTS
ncbi:sigma 54 modulation/S30EA ribosomal C-terminal domain-containing protein [Amycolatopsis sp. NPDC049868]|uniref:sigma 54 modulation/S30EA ribosomal C-terminal domain-containing protein n=1 Tax=Amycolatopsis sp. NPDC049868 TaxID=3363934 RepID=UPI00378D16C5